MAVEKLNCKEEEYSLEQNFSTKKQQAAHATGSAEEKTAEEVTVTGIEAKAAQALMNSKCGYTMNSRPNQESVVNGDQLDETKPYNNNKILTCLDMDGDEVMVALAMFEFRVEKRHENNIKTQNFSHINNVDHYVKFQGEAQSSSEMNQVRSPPRQRVRRTPPKSYQCSDCSFSFSRSHDLRRHESTHRLEKPFVCEGCGRGFSRRDALKRHTTAMRNNLASNELRCSKRVKI